MSHLNCNMFQLTPKFKYIYVNNKHSALRTQCFAQKEDFLSDFSNTVNEKYISHDIISYTEMLMMELAMASERDEKMDASPSSNTAVAVALS